MLERDVFVMARFSRCVGTSSGDCLDCTHVRDSSFLSASKVQPGTQRMPKSMLSAELIGNGNSVIFHEQELCIAVAFLKEMVSWLSLWNTQFNTSWQSFPVAASN